MRNDIFKVRRIVFSAVFSAHLITIKEKVITLKKSSFKRMIAIVLASMLLCLFFAGCQSESESSEGDSNNGRVYWLNFKPEIDETLQSLGKKYTETTGIEVKIVTAASGSYDQTLTSEMDKSKPPTLFVIRNHQDVVQWDKYALDLTNTEIAKKVMVEAKEFELKDDDGHLVALPYAYECYGIIVNTDLLARAGYKIEEIKNFETLKTAVEDIHKRANELGFDAFTSSDMDDTSSWRFTGHMANLEYFYEEKAAGKQWTECPSSITGDYLSNYKNLYDLCINNGPVAPTALATGGHDAENEFKTGKAVFYVNGSWEYEALKDSVDNMAMIPYYCGVNGEEKAGLNCGTENCWAVNASASEKDQKATLDFMVWLTTDKEASQAMVDRLGIFTYTGTPELSNTFLKNANTYIANGNYIMDWATNYQPNVNEYRATLVSALNAYNANQNDTTWDTVKTAFVNGWSYQYSEVNG